MTNKPSPNNHRAPPRWCVKTLLRYATAWLAKKRLSHRGASEHSLWWDFVYRWPREIHAWVDDFVTGRYAFSTRIRFHFSDETIDVCEYRDQLMLSLLFQQIKPTFPHVISKHCLHLQGPNGVKTALRWLHNVMTAKEYRYVIRVDIKSYYASIDHKILLQQVNAAYDDPRIKHYLEAIITTPIDDGGRLFTPQKGIPRRSPLSPFLGALYLSPLDRAFENRTGVFYLRYMDDIVILAQTKNQFVSARKKLYRILQQLRLTLSDAKTRMGCLYEGFHYLGMQFEVQQTASRNPSVANPAVSVTLHARSYRRALDRIRVMGEGTVNPDYAQRYLIMDPLVGVYSKSLIKILLSWP